MEILDSEMRFDPDFTDKKEWIPVIDFKSIYQNKIVAEYAKLPNANEKMLELLKFFNPNIFSVNMQLRAYQVHYNGEDVLLSIINDLSTGERFLAMCLMAHETKNKVYLSNEISQLAKPTILKLMEMFKDSKYVNLVPPTTSFTLILRSLV